MSLSLLLAVDDGNIVLDPSIRDWVLLPIFLVMFGQGLLRQYISVLLKDPPKPVTVDALGKAALLRRSQRFRAHASFLPPSSFKARRKFLISSAFAEPAPASIGPDGSVVAGEEKKEEAPPQDPLAMVGMVSERNHDP